jgi:hypothetical protein
MRTFLTFLYREWRDSRTLVLGAALFCWVYGIVSHTLLTVLPHQSYSPWVAVFAAALTADRFAGEIATRRLAVLAALPVSPARLWLYKITFLIALSAGFAAFILAGEVLWTTFFYCDAKGYRWHAFKDMPAAVGASVCVIAAVAFASVLVSNGMAAFLLGAGLLVLTFASAYGLSNLLEWADLEAGPRLMTSCFGAAASLFLALSFALFCNIRTHANIRMHSLKRGLAALAIFVGIAASAGAITYKRAVDYIPAEPADVDHFAPSPDGKLIALSASGSSLGIDRSSERGRKAHFVWVLRVADGAITPVRARHAYIAPRPWQDGKLCVVQLTELVKQEETHELAVDPETGAVLGNAMQLLKRDYSWMRRPRGESPDRSKLIVDTDDAFEIRDSKTGETRARFDRKFRKDPKTGNWTGFELLRWLEGHGGSRYLVLAATRGGHIERRLIDLDTNKIADLGQTCILAVHAFGPDKLLVPRLKSLDITDFEGNKIRTLREYP